MSEPDGKTGNLSAIRDEKLINLPDSYVHYADGKSAPSDLLAQNKPHSDDTHEQSLEECVRDLAGLSIGNTDTDGHGSAVKKTTRPKKRPENEQASASGSENVPRS